MPWLPLPNDKQNEGEREGGGGGSEGWLRGREKEHRLDSRTIPDSHSRSRFEQKRFKQQVFFFKDVGQDHCNVKITRTNTVKFTQNIP